MRSDHDLITGLRAPSGERVTACGTFARDAGDRRRRPGHRLTHDRFYVTSVAPHRAAPARPEPEQTGSCRVCQRVLGVPTRTPGDVFAEIGIELPPQAA